MSLLVAFGHRPRRLGQQQPTGQNPAQLLKRHGALVDVEIGAPVERRAAEEAEGVVPGTPHLVKGLVDTGASISTVSDEIATAAGLQVVGTVPLGGVGGTSERPIYAASFRLPEYDIFFPAIQIAGVTLPVPDFQVLIGRDVLERVLLEYHGPTGVFALTENGGEPPAGGTPAGTPEKIKPPMSSLTKVAIGGGILAAVTGGLYAFGAFK